MPLDEWSKADHGIWESGQKSLDSQVAYSNKGSHYLFAPKARFLQLLRWFAGSPSS